jgi:pimeloyl-ACP methyl ester carboxylesterase
MRVLHDAAPGGDAERILLVMLPAAMVAPEDLLEQGFVAALRARALPIDVAVADAHADYYLERGIGERLAADVVAPMRTRGYRRIWFMGMSLGGMGCVAYACRHPGGLEGAILLAPFLGTRGLIAQIGDAGGLARWQPRAGGASDEEQRLLLWLKHYRAADPRLPAIYLGFGADDRYAATSAMLARQLPAERVLRIPGAHDSRTWLRLWEMLLAKNPFLVEA